MMLFVVVTWESVILLFEGIKSFKGEVAEPVVSNFFEVSNH